MSSSLPPRASICTIAALCRYAIGGPGLEDRDGVFFDRYGIAPDGAVLVRPDGFVAWRSSGTGDAQGISRALRQILGR